MSVWCDAAQPRDALDYSCTFNTMLQSVLFLFLCYLRTQCTFCPFIFTFIVTLQDYHKASKVIPEKIKKIKVILINVTRKCQDSDTGDSFPKKMENNSSYRSEFHIAVV